MASQTGVPAQMLRPRPGGPEPSLASSSRIVDRGELVVGQFGALGEDSQGMNADDQFAVLAPPLIAAVIQRPKSFQHPKSMSPRRRSPLRILATARSVDRRAIGPSSAAIRPLDQLMRREHAHRQVRMRQVIDQFRDRRRGPIRPRSLRRRRLAIVPLYTIRQMRPLVRSRPGCVSGTS